MELYLNSEEPKFGTQFIKYLEDIDFNNYLRNGKRIWHVFERD